MFHQGEQVLEKLCMNNLIKYAAAVSKKQDIDRQHLLQLRKTVEEMEAFWGLGDEIDYLKRLNRAIGGETIAVFCHIGQKQKIATVNGLYQYASEMISTQGQEAEIRVQDVKSLVKNLAGEWNMDKKWIEDMCGQLDRFLEQAGKQEEEELRSAPVQM